jgi:hypothetical protein
MADQYQIATIPNYYEPDIQGHNAVKIGEDIYDSIEDAQDAIDGLESDSYCLAHGEAGRPEYVILTTQDADYLSSGRNQDGSNYDWGNNDCAQGHNGDCCGECEGCIAMMIDQDREYAQRNAVEEEADNA